MEQFSHDLTLALEETANGRGRRLGMRRRTRSTGNLPCAPLPTEDSSSSQADHNPHHNNNSGNLDAHGTAVCGGANSNSIQSDSDDFMRSFALKLRNTPMSGNFESDSLNENFSPTRPNTRRKRKFKRMAVEYETTTPSTPGHSNNSPLFPLSNVKKRVLKHTCQENFRLFRANILFCGKRKRSHRERYMEYDSHRLHSSSVPRQSSLFTPKASYLEYKNRSRALSKPCERILPLNKSIVSKIEKISQDSRNRALDFKFMSSGGSGTSGTIMPIPKPEFRPTLVTHPSTSENDDTSLSQKSGVPKQVGLDPNLTVAGTTQGAVKKSSTGIKLSRKARHRRRRMQMQLQFNDENQYMDCGNLNDLLSSSSLSSSDSEAVFTNESDHEGDDELTDWPGNELINFTSKHDFKRAKNRPKLPQIPQDDFNQDDDTLMFTENMPFAFEASDKEKLPGYMPSTSSAVHGSTSDHFPPRSVSMPIDISSAPYQYTKQIESEMSGDTSNNILSSPNTFTEVREIMAGCRRIREERPSYSIITPVNEQLARFLQDETQMEMHLIYNVQEYDKLSDLARLYSLTIVNENGRVLLTKTSKTMQSIRIDRSNFPKLYPSDYKRHCYGDDDSSEMAS